MIASPPPPPPPGGVTPLPVKKRGGDLQSELMGLLGDPNLKNRLRKVKPKQTSDREEGVKEKMKNMSKEERKAREEAEREQMIAKNEQKMAEERENLVVEMLGFMETPNGSIEDLVDRAMKNTSIARGFLYTLVRRGWVKGYRVKVTYPEESTMPKGKKFKFVPCAVFPGIQWTSSIELPDETRENIEIKYPNGDKYVGAGHMYRFDQSIQRHVLDEIVLYKDAAFPPPLIPFTRPEPPQDSSLENRKRWEIWNKKKLEHEQSESAQYHLIYNKLLITDQTSMSCFSQLEETITQIREMNAAVTESFADLPLPELRALVLSIPTQIKQVAKKLHETNGIIIKGSDLKLTPAFIKSLSNLNVPTAQIQAELQDSIVGEIREEEESASRPPTPTRRDSRNNRQSFVNFGGLPMETILPIFQSMKAREANGMDKKARRRLTLW